MTLPAAIRTAAVITAALAAMAVTSCSTTRRIPADEMLYTGVKKIQITTEPGTKQAPGLAADVKSAVNVAPNNCLVSPYLRYPLPIGLWVYNNWNPDSRGLKGWLYRKLVREPVLISDVRPEVRAEMIEQILDNHGYFRGHATYELLKGRNPKKASVLYKVVTGPEYPIDSVEMLPDTCRLYHLIDSIARRGTYLHPGVRYSTDSLAAERVRIVNALRNRGYYFFRPDYIEYLADSTITPGAIALRLTVASNVPSIAMEPWRTGRILTRINRNQGGGTPDTTITRRGQIIQMMPSRLRKGLIPGCITFRTGRTFSVRDMNMTQTRLSRLGIFNGIDISVFPDTTTSERLLDVEIDCTFDAPLEASLEVNATSKSNSYIGPGLMFGITNRNLFGGGEQLGVTLTGSYEWQTGRDRGKSVFNSYELGLTTSLSFPRLLAPRFIPRSRRDLNWTRISLNVDLLNRPHYFRLAQFNTSFNYDWRLNRHTTNTLTPLKLTYTKLIRSTAEFDSVMDANPAIAESFRSQFIPQLMYSFTYDREWGHNRLNWTFTVQEAGNLFWSIYHLCGKKGEKELFGTPFSQFIKGQTQLVYGRRIFTDHWLVARAAVGAAHAYGNSTTVPYSEQFYVGGANSVRAFTVRSIGPGSYKVPDNLINGYFDQTGTFKFEFNLEYRFPIFGPLHGAVFFDAGNVWLLKEDPLRPGGLLRGRTFLRDLATGTGAGLRLDIGMLVVRGDLGVGIHLPYDTGKGGYYNMTSFKNSLAFHLAIGYPF